MYGLLRSRGGGRTTGLSRVASYPTAQQAGVAAWLGFPFVLVLSAAVLVIVIDCDGIRSSDSVAIDGQPVVVKPGFGHRKRFSITITSTSTAARG